MNQKTKHPTPLLNLIETVEPNHKNLYLSQSENW